VKHYLVILLLIIFVACSSRPVPRGILLPAQMEKIILDLVKADEFINGFVLRDSTVNIKVKRSTLYTQVFAVHKTTREEFYKSYHYYQQHPDKHKMFFDSLSAHVNRIEDIKDTTKIKKLKVIKPLLTVYE
jgi:hypothetical protein